MKLQNIIWYHPSKSDFLFIQKTVSSSSDIFSKIVTNRISEYVQCNDCLVLVWFCIVFTFSLFALCPATIF